MFYCVNNGCIQMPCSSLQDKRPKKKKKEKEEHLSSANLVATLSTRNALKISSQSSNRVHFMCVWYVIGVIMMEMSSFLKVENIVMIS